jgi:hypothetical protein
MMSRLWANSDDIIQDHRRSRSPTDLDVVASMGLACLDSIGKEPRASATPRDLALGARAISRCSSRACVIETIGRR